MLVHISTQRKVAPAVDSVKLEVYCHSKIMEKITDKKKKIIESKQVFLVNDSKDRIFFDDLQNLHLKQTWPAFINSHVVTLSNFFIVIQSEPLLKYNHKW